MGKIIEIIGFYMSDSTLGLGKKFYLITFIVLLLIHVDDYYGISYFLSNTYKIDYINSLVDAKKKCKEDKTMYDYYDMKLQDALRRKSIFDIHSYGASSIKEEKIRDRSQLIEQNTNKFKEYPQLLDLFQFGPGIWFGFCVLLFFAKVYNLRKTKNVFSVLPPLILADVSYWCMHWSNEWFLLTLNGNNPIYWNYFCAIISNVFIIGLGILLLTRFYPLPVVKKEIKDEMPKDSGDKKLG